jgi:hypothetical protein
MRSERENKSNLKKNALCYHWRSFVNSGAGGHSFSNSQGWSGILLACQPWQFDRERKFAMDPHDYPRDHVGDKIGLMTFLALILAGTLALCIVLLTISGLAQIESDVGEIVAFDPGDGARVWMQPGIAAASVSPNDWSTTRSEHLCTLMPSVMAIAGGSLIVEAKQSSWPPLFRVHWPGPRTDTGRW